MIDLLNTASILKAIEIIGLFTGLTYVVGAILEKQWCWYFGITATISYAISTYFFKLYGEFVLQFFYLAIAFYGLYQWRSSNVDLLSIEDVSEKKLKIGYSSIQFLAINFVLGSLLSYLIYLALIYFESTYPFWDAITSGFGIIATYMTVKKKIENWIIWIIIDFILCIILYLKQMPFYSALYFVYIAFAILGFFRWKKEISKSF